MYMCKHLCIRVYLYVCTNMTGSETGRGKGSRTVRQPTVLTRTLVTRGRSIGHGHTHEGRCTKNLWVQRTDEPGGSTESGHGVCMGQEGHRQTVTPSQVLGPW